MLFGLLYMGPEDPYTDITQRDDEETRNAASIFQEGCNLFADGKYRLK